MADSILSQQSTEGDGPPSPLKPPPEHLPVVTLETLARGDGRDGDDAAILVCLLGVVYDVSAGRNFYGPGGPYAVFAGADATRGLASFNMNAKDKGGDYSDLCERHVRSVKRWQKLFETKYKVVGRLERREELPKSASKAKGAQYVATGSGSASRRSLKPSLDDDSPLRRGSNVSTASYTSISSQKRAISGFRTTKICHIL